MNSGNRKFAGKLASDLHDGLGVAGTPCGFIPIHTPIGTHTSVATTTSTTTRAKVTRPSSERVAELAQPDAVLDVHQHPPQTPADAAPRTPPANDDVAGAAPRRR